MKIIDLRGKRADEKLFECLAIVKPAYAFVDLKDYDMIALCNKLNIVAIDFWESLKRKFPEVYEKIDTFPLISLCWVLASWMGVDMQELYTIYHYRIYVLGMSRKDALSKSLWE